MGQKVHPTGFRLGVVKKHNANWYAYQFALCFFTTPRRKPVG